MKLSKNAEKMLLKANEYLKLNNDTNDKNNTEDIKFDPDFVGLSIESFGEAFEELGGTNKNGIVYMNAISVSVEVGADNKPDIQRLRNIIIQKAGKEYIEKNLK